MTVLLDFGKCSSVALDGLTDAAVSTVQLHGALDFESRRVGRIARDANEY
jgi:hypothetical protein